jgi:hypothetical protein
MAFVCTIIAVLYERALVSARVRYCVRSCLQHLAQLGAVVV